MKQSTPLFSPAVETAAIGQGGLSNVTHHADIPYDIHERTKLDVWQVDGEGPRPLLVFIHGGGWTNSEKPSTPEKFLAFLERGISVAAINYRYSTEAPLPAPVHDAARALQFLRSKADEWNIDKGRIALTGSSAGGCTSLWLATHDDLADPTAADPVRRESTRVIAAAVSVAQSSIDPKVIVEWLGPNVLQHRMIWLSVGEPTMAAALENYDKHKDLYHEFSPYNHLSANDPPILMTYNRPMTLPSTDGNHGIHHPVYGVKMKEKSDQLGHELHVIVDKGPRWSEYDSMDEFLMAKLLAG